MPFFANQKFPFYAETGEQSILINKYFLRSKHGEQEKVDH